MGAKASMSEGDSSPRRLVLSIVGAEFLVSGGEGGRVADVVANFVGEGYPRVTGLLGTSRGEEVFWPIKYVRDLAAGTILVEPPRDYQPARFERRPGELLLKRDVIGRKLIFIAKDNHPMLVKAADLEISPNPSGTGGFIVSGVIPASPHFLGRLFSRGRPRGRLDFADVEIFKSHVPSSLLKIRYRKLAKIHPSELADLVESASEEEAEEILDAVSEDKELEADVFEELKEKRQLELIARMSDQEVARLLTEMEPDDAVDLFQEIPYERRNDILALINPRRRSILVKLLGFNPESAGGLMSPEYVCVPEEATVADVLRAVARAESLPPSLASTVFVLDKGHRVVGAVPVARVIGLERSVAVKDVMDTNPPTVAASADFTEVVTTMSDYNLTALAVVDERGTLIGVITVDDVLERLVPENWRRRLEGTPA
jgi:CBS domain-containing protein